jgi:hypothetical protein
MCTYCATDPFSHSLVKLSEDTYYTKPAEAKLYYDADSIINHYRLELPKDKEWVWMFDAKGFGIKHLIHIDVGVKLAKLLSSEYSHNLSKIVIINSNMYVNMIYYSVSPFLSKKIRDKIVWST